MATASSVTFATQTYFGRGIKTLTISWIGASADGSVASVTTDQITTQFCQGYDLGAVEIVPRAPAPQAGYGITISDIYVSDLMGGVLTGLSHTTPQYFLPLLNGIVYGARPIFGTLTFALTSQNVSVAQGLCILFLYRSGGE
jgi:hypothetical protein